MKTLIRVYIICILSSTAYGQRTEVILEGNVSDSSFYHVEKISNNEYWAVGEYGILKAIDSTGSIRNIDFPNEGLDLLKVQRIGQYVFILTSNAVIYRYDIESRTFLRKEFPSLKNRCFYDLIGLKNGSLLVCGGATGIAKAKRKIPKGFIATLDLSLENLNIIWKNKRKFVWSLLENENQEVLASVFNGFNTKILKSVDLNDWKKVMSIKGLVHEIKLIENDVWYCGSKSMRYRKHGIFGYVTQGFKRNVTKRTGCLWSLDTVGDEIISVSQSGNLLNLNKQSLKVDSLSIPNSTVLYDIEKISDSKILVVGQGKSAYFIHWDEE